MAESYVHSRLPSDRSIRLLNLHPSRDSLAELECDLIVGNVDDLPSFEALSYAWDTGIGPEMHICTQGKAITITENCYLALQRLRHRFRRRRLWVDAICIDQTCEGERNHQVPLMKDIYGRADCVVVWLGAEDRLSRLCFRGMHVFARHSKSTIIPLHIRRRLSERLFGQLQRESNLAMQEEYGSAGAGQLTDYVSVLGNAPFLAPLIVRSWFDRVWTIQETALSRQCLMICGTDSISWKEFSRSLQWLESWPQYKNTSHGMIHELVWRALEAGGTQRSSAEPDYTLSQLLVDSSDSPCSNPLDKIFGLYAMFNKFGLDVPDADYTKQSSIVYHETTKAVMEHDKSLLLLNIVCWDGLADEWSSWVPDWSKPQPWLTTFGRGNASSHAAASFSFSSDGMHLIVHGLIVDIIDKASQPLHALKGQNRGKTGAIVSETDYHRIVQQWVKMALMVSRVMGMEIWTEALCSTLLLGLSAPSLREQLQAWLEYWMTIVAEAPQNLRGDVAATLRGCEPSQIPVTNGNEVYRTHKPNGAYNTTSLDHYLKETLKDETFFLTTDARMGITPVVAKGDLVVLISGCEHPMILRKAEDASEGELRYRLMGIAYVHGIMNGEAWPSDPAELQEFCII